MKYYQIDYEKYKDNNIDLINATLILIQAMDINVSKEVYNKIPNKAKKYFRRIRDE